MGIASKKDLFSISKLVSGLVIPLGLLNDESHWDIFYLDEYFLKGIIGCQPNDNRTTLWLKSLDLIELFQKNGVEVQYF